MRINTCLNNIDLIDNSKTICFLLSYDKYIQYMFNNKSMK